ncbi:zinc finger and BTB domain-containing protein 7A [Trichonephila clavipes]|nr:zinc finger and BTB domain-containing protein 7A [Trichonephila clavipes]
MLTNQNNNWRPKRYGSTLKSSAKLCDMKYCPICSYTSTEALELRCHMASHVSFQPPFNCPVCYKTFSNKYNVQTHMVIHTATQGFLVIDCVNLSHGQVTRTTSELAPPSPNFYNTPTEHLSFSRFNVHRPLHGRFTVVLGSNS